MTLKNTFLLKGIQNNCQGYGTAVVTDAAVRSSPIFPAELM